MTVNSALSAQDEDINGHFFSLVKLPDYALIIRKQIHFRDILCKLKNHKYATVGSIKRDIDLLWSNCYRFNGQPDLKHPKQSNRFSNFARRLQIKMDAYLREFERKLTQKGWVDKKTQPQKQETQNTLPEWQWLHRDLLAERKSLAEDHTRLTKRCCELQRRWLAAENKLNDISTSKECLICKDRERTYAYLPCGHFCVCLMCKDASSTSACALCGLQSNCVVKIYL